jgi:primosomal protein N'
MDHCQYRERQELLCPYCGKTVWQGPGAAQTARRLRIPVLSTLEAVEYGSQDPIAGGFVLL